MSFQSHREETVERATLELASELAKRATEKAGKAASLLGTASALPHRRLALRDGPDGWLAGLREAHALLTEVLREVDRAVEHPVIPLRASRGGR